MTTVAYPIRYDPPFAPLAGALGMGPAASGVRLTADEIRVRMG